MSAPVSMKRVKIRPPEWPETKYFPPFKRLSIALTDKSAFRSREWIETQIYMSEFRAEIEKMVTNDWTLSEETMMNEETMSDETLSGETRRDAIETLVIL